MTARMGTRVPPHRRPVALKGVEAFTRYAERYPQRAACESAEKIAGAIARKHCAGRRDRVTGAEVLVALDAGPEAPTPASRAVAWMLGSISIPECMRLVVLCGVRHEALARFVRANPQQRRDLVRYLNQFTAARTDTRSSTPDNSR